MPNRSQAMTLVELMITLTIMIGLLAIGITTLRGYIPKQQLIASIQTVEHELQRAQTEATSRSRWTCIKFSSTGVQTFLDVNADHISSAECGSSSKGYQALGASGSGPVLFRGKTLLAAGDQCINPAQIWFDTAGRPNTCSSSGVCDPTGFDIVVSNTDLPEGARSREAEVTSGGFIQLVKPGQAGLIPYAFAKIDPLMIGTGACE
jgi:type II secretory pathway pseudopilin PulG